MPTMSERSVEEILDEVDALAQSVIDDVGTLMNGSNSATGSIEKAVLRGIAVGTEGVQQLSVALERAQSAQRGTEPISEALSHVEQKLTFFQGCTMRRSAAIPSHREQADALAGEAEGVSATACRAPDIDGLVQAYKAIESLEARIMDLRASIRGSEGPEPRVLDLPRARILVARRAVGAAVLALDTDD